MLVRTETFRHAQTEEGGGVTTPTILGAVTTDVNSTETHTADSTGHTVTAGTEMLLLFVLYGPTNLNGGSTETTPSSNVDGAFTLVQAADLVNGTGLAQNPRVGVWRLMAPTAGAHTISWGSTPVIADTLDYSGVALINLDDIDTGDPIGAVEGDNQPTGSNTFADAITTEKSNSLVISWGAFRGNDSLPITEDFGTQLVEFSTGISNSADAGMSVATQTGPETPGAVSYGFTASVSDDYAWGAIEIRGAD